MGKNNKRNSTNRSKTGRNKQFEKFMSDWNMDNFNIKSDKILSDPKDKRKKTVSDKILKNTNSVNNPKNLFIANKLYQYNRERKKTIVKAKGYGKIIDKPSIKIMFLGGLNEIGKNFTLFECLDDIFILDCGITFPNEEMLGVDLVLPDFTYIERNKEKIKGIVITHGHEDHIGAIPYLLKQGINLPIYATPLAGGLIKSKLKEHGLLKQANIISVTAGRRVNIGCMNIEFIHVNHSIPDAVGIAIHSPAGVVVHTGDFKVDFTPLQGDMIDLQRFAELGRRGVLALLADSTNAEKSGYTITEQKVIRSIEELFHQAGSKRIIIASFASNVNRISQIIRIAENYGRKVAFSGRSMLNYIAIAKELGYVKFEKDTVIDIDRLSEYADEDVVLITTGSQGEPMSALARMASGEHNKICVGINDFIILSARPIPGNEKAVGDIIDRLLKRGCTVIYESMYEVHVSGHACQEELKIIHTLVKPKYFIPVHGEHKHLIKHAELAKSLGMDDENVFVGDNGNVIELNEVYMNQLPSVPVGQVLVDGIGIGDVGSIVLRDRRHLGQDGLIIVVVALDKKTGNVESGPDIVSRGFVYVRESEPLIESAKNRVICILDDCRVQNVHEWGIIKSKIKDNLSKFFFEKTRRNPMILPIIMDI
ncbi:MAG: ribonuclease J [Clostridia bacterium]|nr:ribonuclease J [Clostridia bacterium]